MNKIQLVIVCRQASDSLKPGNVRAYECRTCKKQLQVSPTAIVSIKSGGIPLCNTCGMKFTRLVSESGTPLDVIFSPSATAQLEEMLRKVGES